MDNKLKCLLCGKTFKHLGSHIAHGHKITARAYKEEFGLPYNMALISEDIKLKKREAFWENSAKYLDNLMKSSEKFRFKKGRSGQRRISQHERETVMKRILEVNKKHKKKEPCPVCKMTFNNMQGHLLLKHKLIQVK